MASHDYAVELVGDPKSVDRYRKYLHEKGTYTKNYRSFLERSGMKLAPKPHGFESILTSIRSVHQKSSDGSSQKIQRLKEDERLFISGLANENIVDRYSERLEPAGVELANYMKNPVLLVDHMYIHSTTVGRLVSVDPQQEGVKFEAYIGDPAKAPLTKVQQETRSLVAQKLLQTVSVGFIPHKIQAPVFDNDGKLQDPAVILAWELLELSVVAVPANPGSVFELKDGSEGSKAFTKIGGMWSPSLTASEKTARIETKQDSTVVQTLIFSKEQFSEEEAVLWAKDNDYKADKVDETDDTYRIRQKPPEEFEEGSLKTIEMSEGVRAIVGRLVGDKEDEKIMEEKILEMLDTLKGIKTLFADLQGDLKSIKEASEGIVSRLDAGKGGKPMDEDEEDKEEEKEEGEKPEEEEEEEDKEKGVAAQEAKDLKQRMSLLEKNIDKISGILLKLCAKSNG